MQKGEKMSPPKMGTFYLYAVATLSFSEMDGNKSSHHVGDLSGFTDICSNLICVVYLKSYSSFCEGRSGKSGNSPFSAAPAKVSES